MTLWRIAADTPDYAVHDPSGKGAEQSGGRWNRVGTPMLYSSVSRALACLETVVHLADAPLPLNRYLVKITVSTAAWKVAKVVDPAKLIGWDAEPAGSTSLDWGTRWADSKATLLARVPSVIVPEEWNVLINPAHPEMPLVKSVKVRKWLYDTRLASG